MLEYNVDRTDRDLAPLEEDVELLAALADGRSVDIREDAGEVAQDEAIEPVEVALPEGGGGEGRRICYSVGITGWWGINNNVPINAKTKCQNLLSMATGKNVTMRRIIDDNIFACDLDSMSSCC